MCFRWLHSSSPKFNCLLYCQNQGSHNVYFSSDSSNEQVLAEGTVVKLILVLTFTTPFLFWKSLRRFLLTLVLLVYYVYNEILLYFPTATMQYEGRCWLGNHIQMTKITWKADLPIVSSHFHEDKLFGAWTLGLQCEADEMLFLSLTCQFWNLQVGRHP